MADQRDSGGGQAPRPADQRGPVRPGPEQPAAPAASGQAGTDDTQIIDRGAPDERTAGPATSRPTSLGGVLDDTAILTRVEPAAPNRPGIMLEPETAAGPTLPAKPAAAADETAVLRLPDAPAKVGPSPAAGTARPAGTATPPGTARPAGTATPAGTASSAGTAPSVGSARPASAAPATGSARPAGTAPATGSARPAGTASPGNTVPTAGTASPGNTVPTAGSASPGNTIPTGGTARSAGSANPGNTIPTTGTARPAGTASPGNTIPTTGTARSAGAAPAAGTARPPGAAPAAGTARPAGTASPSNTIPTTGTARPAGTAPAAGTARPPGAAPAAGTAPRPAAGRADPDATTPFRVPVIAGPPTKTDRPAQAPPAKPADDRTEALRSAAPSGRATPAPAKRPDAGPDETAVVRLPDEPWKTAEPAGSKTEVVRLPDEPWKTAEPAGSKTEVVRLPDEPWKAPEPVGSRTEVLRRPGTVAPATDPTEVVRLPHSPTSSAKSTAPAKAGQAVPRKAPRGPGLGQAPWVLVISAIGVLMVALGYAGGRDEASTYPDVLYWAGQVVVFTPVVMRLLSQRLTGGSEAFLLVIGLAVNQYLLKWLYSPDQFRFPDELQHWLATTIIDESGRLFEPNLALPPAVHFPGLAEMGASVSELTGLSVTAAGLLVAGIARLCFVGALFAAVLRASRSPAIAGVSCVIYATALHYLFFNAMYLYGAAALPFLMLSVWAARRWWSGGDWQFALISVVGIAMTTISHHVTAFMLVLTLFLLAFTELVTRKPRPWRALVLPFVALLSVVSWIAFVARDVVAYLEAPIDQAMDAVNSLLNGGSDTSGATASTGVPLVQLAIQGVGLLCLFALYLAVGRDMIAKRDRDAWRWALMIGGAVFFAGNGVRFVGTNGPEIAGRLTTFTYIPMAVVGAIGLVNAVRILPQRGPGGIKWLAPSPPRKPATSALPARLLAGSAAITVLMLGARAGGWPPEASLLPGPYVAAGFERSVDGYGIAAADWEYYVLGPRKRVGGDITAVSLSSTYGRQDPVREAAPLFYDTEWSNADDQLVEQVGLEYLVVDRRITESLPVNGAYFDNDPRAGQITTPLTVAEISKFDDVERISRLYDNGNVRIYRMGHL